MSSTKSNGRTGSLKKKTKAPIVKKQVKQEQKEEVEEEVEVEVETEAVADSDGSLPAPSSSQPIPCAYPYEVEPGGVPVFHPTWEQFKDFAVFVETTNAVGAHFGLMKIIPPAQYRPNKSNYKNIDLNQMMIHSPIRQKVHQVQGFAGAYRVYAVDEFKAKQSVITVAEFEGLSIASEAARSMREKKLVEEEDWEELERKFWSQTLTSPPLYGADSPGTLFDADCQEWNVGNLPSLLHALDHGIPGVSLPFLYWGQWKSMFAWHVEDINLYSINFVHHGRPKQWYGIPPRFRSKFESVLQQIYPIEFRNCPEFMRHKEHIVSATVLKERYNIPVIKTRQRRGEFMLTWPTAYHQGFNYGFNCAESVNFANSFWFPFSRDRCYRCRCRGDSVWFSAVMMQERVRQLQYLYRKSQEDQSADNDKKKKKKQPLTITTDAASSASTSDELTLADVPAKYQLDTTSIWLGLPTNPNQLKLLSQKYFARPVVPGGDASVVGEDVPSGRSMGGRSMTSVAPSESPESGFLFEEDNYNRMNTNDLDDDRGYLNDANAVHCSYPDCTKPLHRTQADLMRHYKTAHTSKSKSTTSLPTKSIVTTNSSTEDSSSANSTTTTKPSKKRKVQEEKEETKEEEPKKSTNGSSKKKATSSKMVDINEDNVDDDDEVVIVSSKKVKVTNKTK